ncbi:MFS transporter [Dactylosporangium sp. NPDC049525]|uniref:MFS transporter n=1 Tax=Dactylosporangium sp. NPDC049525 TaxID=3154730 RepID=UPI003414B3C7
MFWSLMAAHLINRLGGFVQPFLVLYLTQDRQLTAGTAGAVAATVGIGTVASHVVGGWLTDRVGRRRTMLTGFAGAALALIGLGTSGTTVTISMSAFAVGLTSELFRPALSATVADLLEPGARVRAFGMLLWAANLGFSVSTVSAGVLAAFGYGLLFWINAATSAVAAIIVACAVRETRPVGAPEARRSLLPVATRDFALLLSVAILVVYATIYFQGYSTLALVTATDGLSPSEYGALIAVNGLLIVLLQPLAVRYLANRDRSTVMAASMLIVGVGFGLGALVHNWQGYGLSVVVWTVGEIGVANMFGAIFADLAPADLRGGYMGLSGLSWGLGAVLGPALGTVVLDQLGRAVLWGSCAVLGAALFAAQLAIGPMLRHRAAGAESGDPPDLPSTS